MRTLQHLVRACSLAVAGLALGVSPAWSAEVWLEARPLVGTEYLAGVPSSVPMWGYASCDSNWACGPAAVPGPQLVVPAGDPSGLTIHLRNSLPATGLTVPNMTSIVIPGQRENGMAPVMSPPETSPHGVGQPDRVRMRSFTHETLQGQEGNYIWSNLKPGTYLYHSGTHAQVQVQMGLYGSVKADAAAGQAYTVPVAQAYNSEATLLFSEIDPALHAEVANGTYGTPNHPTSTINYQPKYFLMNGAPYSASTAPIAAGQAGQRVLLRLLNAGLESHVATLLGGHFQVIAEDGNALAHGRDQYETLLPAGKTMDAIWVPATNGAYSIYDRRNRQGMLAKLEIGLTAAASTAVNDAYSTPMDTPLTVAARGVLLNDQNAQTATAVLVTGPATGLVFNADGSFTYTPSPTFFGQVSFTYKANNGVTDSNIATATIAVIRPPVITSTPPLTALVGVPYRYTMTATGLALPIEYDPWGANPAGLTVGITTGVVSWTPTLVQRGNQVLQLQAMDTMDQITEQNFTVVVNDGPPKIISTPPLTAKVGVPYPYTMTATDLDAPVEYDPWGTNPAGLTVGITTGVVSWTPTAAQVGPQRVQLQALDTTGLITEQNFTVTVAPANSKPVAVANVYAVNKQAAFMVPATGVLGNDSDVDGNPLTAVQATNPSGAVSLNPDGSFTYTTTAGYVGTRVFKYYATDGLLNSATVNVTLIKDLTVSSITIANNGDWVIRGKSTKPNTTVEVFANATTGTNSIGTATVGGNGAWTRRVSGATLSSGQQISVRSSTGAEVIEVPVP